MSGIIGIGLRSMMAYQMAIELTAQNLSNRDTPFYSRRDIQFVNDMFNNGVHIGNAARIYDDVLNDKYLKAGSDLGRASVLYNQISDFEKQLDNDNVNINKFLNDSLSAIQDLTNSVSSGQSRQAYLLQLSNIANRFNVINNDIMNRKSAVNQDMTNTIQQANNLLDQISSINEQLLHAEGNSADTLKDQQNALVHELAGYINFDTSFDDHGGVVISLSNGYNLISGSSLNHLSLQANASDPNAFDLIAGEGGSKINATQLVTAGQISGMMTYKSSVLDAAENGLNKLALALSQLFNQQNKLGIDLNGNIGRNLFNDINSASMLTGRVIVNSNNTGSGSFSVNVDNVGQLTSSDYKLVFSDATHYSMVRTSDNQSVSSGVIAAYPATISADGFSITISSGAFAAGDSFLVKPTAGGMQNCNLLVKDPSLLALGYPVSAERDPSNHGQGIINVDSIVDTTNSSFSTSKQLNPPIIIQFLTDTTYQIVNANTNAVMEGPVTYDPMTTNNIFPTAGSYDPGYRVSLSGAVKAGDAFNINYNLNFMGDTRNALKFKDVYSSKVLDSGGYTLSEYYRSVSLGVSGQANSAKISNDSSSIIYNQAEARFYEKSGVYDAEEMVNLAEYQKALQASAQIVQVAKTIFDTIIGLSR